MMYIQYMTDVINYAIRIERSLKDAMKADAEKHARSLNAHMIKIYEQYLNGELVAVEELLSNPQSKRLIAATIEDALKKEHE